MKKRAFIVRNPLQCYSCSKLLRAVTIWVWNRCTLIMQTLTWILATDGVVTQTMTVYCAWRKVNYGFKIPRTILYTNEMHVFNFIAKSSLSDAFRDTYITGWVIKILKGFIIIFSLFFRWPSAIFIQRYTRSAIQTINL